MLISSSPIECAQKAYKDGDYSYAIDVFFFLAEKECTQAQTMLGVMCENGQGITQNYNRASEWYSKSAKKDCARSQFNLSVLYKKGWGVPYNPVIAYILENLAASQGHEQARKSRDISLCNLSRDQIDEGQKISTNWSVGLPLPTTIDISTYVSTPDGKNSEVYSLPENLCSTDASYENNEIQKISKAPREVSEYKNLEYERKNQEMPYPHKPKGVGGFLKFFVIVGCIIGPVIGLISIFSQTSSIEKELSGLSYKEGWGDFKSIVYTSSFIGTAVLFWLASEIYGSDLRSTKFKAIGALWVAGPFRAITEVIVITVVLPIGMSRVFMSELFIDIFILMLFATVWTLYFLFSKRVANTYWR